MECDRKAETFSDALFTYLWFTENLISGSAAAETVGDMSEFIAEVAKAVVVLSALTVPTFNESMEEYFKENDMSRRSVFTFLTRYCFNNHAENPDIFSVVLNTCTFVYRLVIFCQHRGHVEYIEFASMCWAEIFEMDLKKDFYAKGGWEEFRKYVACNRYVPTDKDTDHKAFINFLDEINYLFPKLKISEQEEFTNCFTAESLACAQLEAGNSSEGIRTSSPEMLNSAEFCQSSDYLNSSSIFGTSDESADENNALNNTIAEASDLENHEQLNPRCIRTSEETSDSLDDSDEDMFEDLIRQGLNTIRKLNSTPPSKDCVICQNPNDIRTVRAKDTVCLKHDPDSFYYMVTHSETERESD